MTFNITEGMTFATLESAESTVQSEAKKEGFAVLRRSSHLRVEVNHKSRFVKLVCTQWGRAKSQETQKNTQDGKESEENGEERQERNTKSRTRRTSKKNCEFMIRIVEQGNKWTVKRLKDIHNHPMLDKDDIYALPAHRKLTTEQNNLIAQSIKTNASTFATVNAINSLYPGCPNTTVKDVINKKAALRDSLNTGRNKASLVPMMQSLESKGYIVVKQQNKNGELTHLFFAHPSCLKQVIKCSEVLIVDSTYKTNCFNYPMINTVGVSNVYGERYSKEHGRALMNFQVALAWVRDEREETYVWFFRNLKEHIYNACNKLPELFISDCDKSIRNAIKVVYPQSKTMICVWHVLSKSLKEKTRAAFESVTIYDEFSNLAWQLHYCKDQSKIPSLISNLEKYCDQHGKSTDQIQKAKKFLQSIMNEKENWIRAYVDHLPHFNNYSTGRAESQHSTLKRNMLLAVSLENAFEFFHNVIISQQTKYNRSKSLSALTSNPKSIHGYRLKEVTYKISLYAIDQLENQISLFFNERETDITRKCTGFMNKVLSLPCRHQMDLDDPAYIIPLRLIPQRWHLELTEDERSIVDKISSLVPKNVTEIDKKLDNVLIFIKNIISRVEDNNSRLELIKRLERWGKNNQNVSEVELIKPEVRAVAKGRPKIANREKLYSEKVEEKCIKIEKEKRKRLQSKRKIEIPAKRPRYIQYSNMKSEDEFTESVNKEQRIRSFGDLHYFSPDVVTNVINVGGDGHCGFRALALLLGKKEKKFYKVRTKMRMEMDEVIGKYMGNTEYYSVKELRRIMEHTGEKGCDRDQWFSTPECAQLAAEAYKTPIVTLEPNENDLYIPLLCKPEDAKRRAPFVLRFSVDHYHAFFVDFNHPSIGNPPPFRLNAITRNMLRTNRNTYFAANWEEVFPGCFAEEHSYKPRNMTGPVIFESHSSSEDDNAP